MLLYLALPFIQETLLKYDGLHRVTGMLLPDAGHITLSYDERGNLTSFQMPNGGVTQYQYDDRNRVVIMWDVNGNKSEFTYTLSRKIATVKNPFGAVRSYEYTPNGLVEAIMDFDGTVQRFSYKEFTFDAANQLADAVCNGAKTQYSYNGTRQRVGYETERTNQPMQKTQYLLDFTELVDNVIGRTLGDCAESYVHGQNVLAMGGRPYTISCRRGHQDAY